MPHKLEILFTDPADNDTIYIWSCIVLQRNLFEIRLVRYYLAEQCHGSLLSQEKVVISLCQFFSWSGADSFKSNGTQYQIQLIRSHGFLGGVEKGIERVLWVVWKPVVISRHDS